LAARVPCAALACASLGLAGCGDRAEGWDKVPYVTHTVGLASSFALVDQSSHVVSLFAVGSDLSVAPRRHAAGIGVVNVASSRDGSRLFVLSEGVQPRRRAEDDLPALTVYDGTGSGAPPVRYDLGGERLSGLAVDPLGQWVVVYNASKAFVSNQNVLVFVDVTQPPVAGQNPRVRTLLSFGSSPQRFTFTPELDLQAGKRRLLVVETQREVQIQDLSHLERSEVTVQLNSGDVTTSVQPAGVLVDDGEPDRTDDARIAVRTANEAAVYVLTLGPPATGGTNDFYPTPNIIGLASVPSDVAFVRTDAGRRLAVLQPLKKKATLIDADTTVPTDIDMPAAYGRMALVTGEVQNAPEKADVALLWGGGKGATGVAFWSLGKSVGQPYRSIEMLNDVFTQISDIVAVPPPNDGLKVLKPDTSGTSSVTRQFYVLDLRAHAAYPLTATGAGTTLEVAADGKRLWLYEKGGRNVARVDLGTLYPRNLTLDSVAASVFDLGRAGGGRAMVAVHASGTYGATVFDADSPDEAAAVTHVGLLQGGY
jgi:hypothetical protein